MKLLEQIKKDRDNARKAGDTLTVSVLATLIGEVENGKLRGTIKDDAGVIVAVKKFIQSNLDTLKIKESDTLRAEIVIYSRYVPVELSNEEIEAALAEPILNGTVKSLGEAMALMKKNFTGKYNGKEASRIAKELLEV